MSRRRTNIVPRDLARLRQRDTWERTVWGGLYAFGLTLGHWMPWSWVVVQWVVFAVLFTCSMLKCWAWRNDPR